MVNGKVVTLLVTVGLLLIGLIFGGAFIGMGITEKRKKQICTRRTTGTVTDIQEERMNGSIGEAPLVSWHPVFTYEADGHEITKRSSYGNSKQMFYVGQKVNVFYNPKNPNEYLVPEEKTSNVRWIFLLVSLGLILAGGMALAFYLYFFVMNDRIMTR